MLSDKIRFSTKILLMVSMIMCVVVIVQIFEMKKNKDFSGKIANAQASCPGGYVMVDGSFCILQYSLSLGVDFSWSGAAGRCAKEVGGHLCSATEWETACNSLDIADPPAVDYWEWVDDIDGDGSVGVMIGSGDCSTTQTYDLHNNMDLPNPNHPDYDTLIRCCLIPN